MNSEQNIFKSMEDDINNSNIDESLKKRFFDNIFQLKKHKINLMVTGATGCGKSSTINALFNTEVAKVGIGVEPETMDIRKYTLKNLILWDSPGLGDGKEKDVSHSKAIIDKLNEIDNNGNALIDLVLVILDGSTRDLGTSYELINKVIIPNLGEEPEKRILVAINQADVAMKGRNCWNEAANKPEKKLEVFLNDKVNSVKKRIKEATGIDVAPIYYAAGFKEEGEKQNPYNLSKLLYFIIQNTPKKKRLSYVNNISANEEMWEDNDEIMDYNNEIKRSFVETIKSYATAGAEFGTDLGSVFGATGEAIGKVGGALLGGAVGLVSSGFSTVASWFGG